MINRRQLIKTELRLLLRDYAFLGLIGLLFFLMFFASWNTHRHLVAKKGELDVQLEVVKENDRALALQIDSLNQGLATYEDQYTLPTSAVRLTYNNHRIAWKPVDAFNLIAIGQSDLYNNYKKIVLYFNDSYERASHELVSPIEQLFGQLDLAFVWTYLLPLIIILVSFNILSAERESGRLKLIASQPVKVAYWLIVKIGIRFFSIFALLLIFTFFLLNVYGVPVFQHSSGFGELISMLFLYTAFWFFLSLVVNLAGYSSGRSLILLTNLWVLFVFLIPSVVNQLSNELHPVPTRLEMVNHHQHVYNEVEAKLEEEMEGLFRLHPDWRSDDPVTKDRSNSTGWNINFLAKQYLAQLKHQPQALRYEEKIDERNRWADQFRILSPAMIFQNAVTDLAGTSTRYYRDFLRQSQEYAQDYRAYVFKGLFTNHAFSSKEVKNLPAFTFERQHLQSNFWPNVLTLLAYLIVISVSIFAFTKTRTRIT